MLTYHIKQDGYIIGQATGKKKAVDFVLTLINQNNLVDEVWENQRDGNIEILCVKHMPEGSYSIEYSIERME